MIFAKAVRNITMIGRRKQGKVGQSPAANLTELPPPAEGGRASPRGGVEGLQRRQLHPAAGYREHQLHVLGETGAGIKIRRNSDFHARFQHLARRWKTRQSEVEASP